MLLVGLLTLLAAIGLGAYAALGGTTVTAAGTDASTGSMSVPLAVLTPTVVDAAPALPRLLRTAGGVAGRLTRDGTPHRMQRRLDLAGNPRSWNAERVLAYKGVGLAAGALLGLLFGSKHGVLPAVGWAAAAAAAGLMLPNVLVHNLGQKRQIQIRLGLPDALDVLTVCVEAGLGFDAALGRVARNLEGPVAHECARVLQEMQFGKSRADALRALTERTDVPEVRSFVAAVVQSGELGIPIGDVLREQARDLRLKRRQRAQEKAQKLQVKLLVPMITCLLPAMFVVVLGPAIIELIGFFGTVNK